MNYSFHIYIISDGVRSGLLLQRKKADDPHTVSAYFWLDEQTGLYPTPEIIRHCNNGCHKLEYAENHKKHPHKYARYRDQELIFRELKAYAEVIAAHPDMINAQKRLTQDYSHAKKEYPEVLSRFFTKPRTPFADFFVSLGDFTECVLKNFYSLEMIIGRAKEFAFLDPQNLFPQENLNYFLTAEELLEVKNPPPAQWFRDNGPVYSDFEKKKYYRRSEVTPIEQIMLSNINCLLLGDAATGKTIIVRTAIYEMYKNGRQNIFYFDIAPRRYFDETKLIQEIRSVKGRFIIENIHLEQQKVQLIYDKYKNDPDRHFLFTARQPRDENPRLILKDLPDINTVPIEVFVDADKLIDCFCNDPETSPSVRDKRHDIVEVSKGDFWRLAFALKQCDKTHGQGDPQSWIKDQVLDRLRSLESCRDEYSAQYPGILVALSPLYTNETLTSENYFEKLNFTREAINGLVERAEITRQTDAYNNTYYGLLHSSQAKAYWEHGKKYIENPKLRDYEEFICDYIISDTSNGLEAVLKLTNGIRKMIQDRLDKSGQIIKVIEREQSIQISTAWIIDTYYRRGVCEGMIWLLADKINKGYDFDASANSLYDIDETDTRLGLLLLQFLDIPCLAKKISQTKNVKGACDFITTINSISFYDESIENYLCTNIDIYLLAERLVSEDDPNIPILIDNVIWYTNIENFRKTLNINALANKLSNIKDLEFFWRCIYTLRNIHLATAHQLCSLLNLNNLAELLNRYKGQYIIDLCIEEIYAANKSIACALIKILHKNRAD